MKFISGYQNWYSHESDIKIQKYKYTNTQIHNMTRCQKDPTCVIFLKIGLFKDIKNDIPMSQTCKYKNTNTQIHKYTNTAYDKVPERLNMLYIFERVQKILKNCKLFYHPRMILVQKKLVNKHKQVMIGQHKSIEVVKIHWFCNSSLLLKKKLDIKQPFFPSCRNWPIYTS